MTIQHRTALIFATLTISLVLIVSTIEYYFVNQNAFEDFYKRLEIRAIVAAKAAFEKEGSNTYEEIRKLHLETLPGEKEYFLKVNKLQHDAAASGLQLSKQLYAEAIAGGRFRYKDNNRFYLGYLYKKGVDHYIVIISANNVYINTYLSNLRNVIIISLIATVIISVFTGLWFSNITLRPIRLITAKMQDISANQLHLRLGNDIGSDEISILSQTFNNMLDRLESAFETHKNFISHASHELNTPLTSIIGESEYALSKQRNQQEYEASLGMIFTQAERLRKITDSLLHLAQTGYNGKNQEFTQVFIDEILYTVKQTINNIIPDNKISINTDLMPEDQSKLLVKGNEALLELALANLALNACKYSGNKPVNISTAATHAKVIVIIEDMGIGIPQSEMPYIYDPFFRASNTTAYKGFGIGLPLARNIIRMHHGELEVISEENVGTKIKVTLPIYNA